MVHSGQDWMIRHEEESLGQYALRLFWAAADAWIGFANDELSDAIAAVHGEWDGTE
ncbi:MAG: hypothetical protein AAGA67_08235 [Cyanobacteria bacterium P01_F01_bin.153]